MRKDTASVIEIVEFRTVPEMNDEEFIKIVEVLESDFHYRQSGFIDSELGKVKEGRWVIIQHWQSMAELKAVIKMMMKEPMTEEFRRAIDPASVRMTLLEQVMIWSK